MHLRALTQRQPLRLKQAKRHLKSLLNYLRTKENAQRKPNLSGFNYSNKRDIAFLRIA